jgi:Flp pilus assembly pilin Flp
MEFLRASQARLSAGVIGWSRRGEGGQALIEYALIVSLVALAAFAALSLTGTHLGSLLNKIAGDV